MVISIREKELFERLRTVIGHSYDLPKTGTGAPGMLLEQLLGVESNNEDLPDAGGWEIKFHGGASLLTLFHLNPSPQNAIKTLIEKHGWTGRDGRQCFRHTISGRSDRGFCIVDEDERLIVRHPDGTEAYWTHDEVFNAASSKMRKLIMVSGRKDRMRARVAFNSAAVYSEFKPTAFIPAATQGIIKIDFDARYKNGKRIADAVRDHGTKFRIKTDDLKSIYGKVQEFSIRKGKPGFEEVKN